MNDLTEILKTFFSYFQSTTVLGILPFTGIGVIAALIFFLLKKTEEKKPARHSDNREQKAATPDDSTTQTEIAATAGPPGKAGESLTKSRSGLFSKLEEMTAGGKLNEDLWEEFEELLVLADTGVSAAAKIRGRVEKQLSREDLQDCRKIKNCLINEATEILKSADCGTRASGNGSGKPRVFMLVGVNGSGKTTTAGKLAGLMRSEGKKVMLAATDTFRAAAVEQLEIWAQRSGSGFVKGAAAADPSGVAFDAVKSGGAKNCDAVIIDTAGRLHTKTDLMDELSKIKRVIGKAHEGAPHEVFLVLDATTGQNAIRQAQMFKEAVGVTGIILTKLDGTAKGGILIAIAEQLKISVRYVGTGEKIGDFAEFAPERFVATLFDETAQ